MTNLTYSSIDDSGAAYFIQNSLLSMQLKCQKDEKDEIEADVSIKSAVNKLIDEMLTSCF